jgi:hypothetical protein
MYKKSKDDFNVVGLTFHAYHFKFQGCNAIQESNVYVTGWILTNLKGKHRGKQMC